MTIDAETWIAKVNPTLGSLFRVTRDGEDVVVVPASGGWQKRTSWQSLMETHRRASAEDISALRDKFQTILVTGDWFPDGTAALPAWSNGALWNGSPQPMFEKAIVEEAMGDGRLAGSQLRLSYDGAHDAFVVVAATDDAGFTDTQWADTVATARSLALHGGELQSVEFKATGGIEIQVDVYTGQKIETPDGPRTVYAIGASNWIWSTADAPMPPAISLGR